MAENPPKNPHALKLAQERAVMDEFGVTRSQAREGLLKAARLTQEAEVKKQVEDEALSKRIQAKVDKAVAALELPAVVQKFEPKPFLLNVDTPKLAEGGGQLGTTLDDMIVVLNGTAYFTNIYTDGRLEEIV